MRRAGVVRCRRNLSFLWKPHLKEVKFYAQDMKTAAEAQDINPHGNACSPHCIAGARVMTVEKVLGV